MKAVGQYIVINPETNKERKSSGGLAIVTASTDRWIEGKVISISKLLGKETGIKDGDTILYDKHAGHDIKSVESKKYKVITIRDVSAVL